MSRRVNFLIILFILKLLFIIVSFSIYLSANLLLSFTFFFSLNWAHFFLNLTAFQFLGWLDSIAWRFFSIRLKIH